MSLLRLGLAGLVCLLGAGRAPAQAYDTRDYVAGLIEHYLGRPARPDEVVSWVRNLRTGTPPSELQAGLLGSDEFFARVGRDNARFIVALGRDILNRDPTPQEVNAWLLNLALANGDRTQLVRNFIISAQPELSSQPAAAPAPTDPAGRLLATSQLLLNAALAELGGTLPGRQVVVRANALLAAGQALRDYLATPNYAPARAWQLYGEAEAAYQAVQDALRDLHFAAPTTGRFVGLTGRLLTAVRATIPNPPPVVAPTVGLDQAAFDRCARGLAELARDSQRLAVLLRGGPDRDADRNKLQRDAEYFASQVEALRGLVRVGADPDDLRRRFYRLRELANGISYAVRGRKPNGRVQTAWHELTDELAQAGDALGVAAGPGIDPDRPVLVNPPTFVQTPYQPIPPAAYAVPREVITAADRALAQVDAFNAGLSRFLLGDPAVPQVQAQVRALRNSLAQLRQEAVGGATGRQRQDRLDEVNGLLQQASQAWGPTVRSGRVPGAPDLGGVAGAVERLNQAARSGS
jgi:hypothetical protein